MPEETKIQTLIYALYNSGANIADLSHQCQQAIAHVSDVEFHREKRRKLRQENKVPSQWLEAKCEL